MIKWIEIILCLAASLLVSAQSKIQPLTFEQFCASEYKIVEGRLTVYYNDEKIYLEIPGELLGRELVVTAQVDQGYGLRNRSLNSIGVVKLSKLPGNYISLGKEILQERLGENTKEFKVLFERSNSQALGLIYPIIAYHEAKKGYIIDITKSIKTDKEWFSGQLESLNTGSGDYQWMKISSRPDEICVTMKRDYVVVGKVNSRIPITISCLVKVLPSEQMRERQANPLFPYATVAYTDYGKMPYGTVRDSIIQRWRMTVLSRDYSKYRKGGKVVPDRPLVCYIDPLCPSEFIPYIRQGIEEWNKAFEQIGFRDAIRVKVAEPSQMLAAETFVVSYDLGKTGVQKDWITHPLTGEILYARLNIGHGVMLPLLDSYWWECGANDERICRNRQDVEIAGEILRNIVAKEMGKLLGLLSPADPGSILSEEFFYRGKLTTLNKQDYRAIAWGYRQFPGTKNATEDTEQLIQVLAEPRNKTDHTVVQQISVIEQSLQRREKMFTRFKKRIAHEDGNLRSDREFYELGLKYHRRDFENFADLIIPENQNRIFELLDCYLFKEIPAPLDIPELWQGGWLEKKEVVRRCCKDIFEKILQPAVIGRQYQDDEGKPVKGIDSFWTHIHQKIWSDFDVSNCPSPWQMEVQRTFVEVFCKILTKDKTKECLDDYGVTMRKECELLKDALQKLSLEQHNSLAKGHYSLLFRKMKSI